VANNRLTVIDAIPEAEGLPARGSKKALACLLNSLDTSSGKMLRPEWALTKQAMILRDTACSDNVEFVWTSAAFWRGAFSGIPLSMRLLMNLRSLLLLALVPCANLSAEVTLPKILSSHMVIERDLPVHVWGMATPGEAVAVSFRGQTRSTKAGQLGRWSVYLSPGAAGGPFQMTVTGTSEATGGEAAPAQTITLDDVLVGDVWVASGQSNMEFLMKQAETASQDLPNAANSKIRLLMVKKKAIEYPQDDADTEGWMSSTPETAKDFSAVAWYFAREIEKREHVPVGG
jgi:hypothetical protein